MGAAGSAGAAGAGAGTGAGIGAAGAAGTGAGAGAASAAGAGAGAAGAGTAGAASSLGSTLGAAGSASVLPTVAATQPELAYGSSELASTFKRLAQANASSGNKAPVAPLPNMIPINMFSTPIQYGRLDR